MQIQQLNVERWKKDFQLRKFFVLIGGGRGVEGGAGTRGCDIITCCWFVPYRTDRLGQPKSALVTNCCQLPDDGRLRASHCIFSLSLLRPSIPRTLQSCTTSLGTWVTDRYLSHERWDTQPAVADVRDQLPAFTSPRRSLLHRVLRGAVPADKINTLAHCCLRSGAGGGAVAVHLFNWRTGGLSNQQQHITRTSTGICTKWYKYQANSF